jgi:serine/threonine protein kinase
MKAEALIGTVLGTCTLQRLIGQGGMGAVYLAQQSRPRRQVAVKVLMPMTKLTPNQLAGFLERFRRETDAAASLEHPNIMPVHEYGEQNGLAYLVMPYISDGTLRDEMEREGQLAFPKIVSYLEQLAAALDFAHERMVIHRDVKPANILKTPEGRLLLTDFGLVKIVAGQGTHLQQMRLTGAGAPVGTPDYMSPEQVMGGDRVDGRADLYSLGVILYQMVTGTTPFQGELPMQVAAQHLQMPPPSPRHFRPDLPVGAEQVMLQALAKRPDDRYPHGQDLAAAFRTALTVAGVPLGNVQTAVLPVVSNQSSGRLFTPRGLFDPSWQTGTVPIVDQGQGIGNPTGALPAANAAPTRSTGLLSRTGMFPRVAGPQADQSAMGTINRPLRDGYAQPNPNTPTGGHERIETRSAGYAEDPYAPFSGMQQAMRPEVGDQFTAPVMQQAIPSQALHHPPDARLAQLSPAENATTGALPVPTAAPTTIKLTAPMKIVQVPVQGQPGRYVTGLLPVTPRQESTEPPAGSPRNVLKMIATALAVLLLLAGAGSFWFIRSHPGQIPQLQTKQSSVTSGTPDLKATVAAQATATFEANLLLFDPLDKNIHNWPYGTQPSGSRYTFADEAYHILDHGDSGNAVVLQENFTGPIVYALTMEEIRGDDTSPNNSFGMILRFNLQTKGGKRVTTFYSFEVVNIKGGEYRFYKYDDSQGTPSNYWKVLWQRPFGSEFHQGQGLTSKNTMKVAANGTKFTFTVNGKVVGTTSDSSFASGTVGMLVNLDGTEVAFSNMLITRN